MSDPAAVMDTYAAVVEEGINWWVFCEGIVTSIQAPNFQASPTIYQ